MLDNDPANTPINELKLPFVCKYIERMKNINSCKNKNMKNKFTIQRCKVIGFLLKKIYFSTLTSNDL